MLKHRGAMVTKTEPERERELIHVLIPYPFYVHESLGFRLLKYGNFWAGKLQG
jgi:hypothetical protein